MVLTCLCLCVCVRRRRFVNALVENVPRLVADVFKNDELHARQFLAAAFSRCKGIEGQEEDPMTGEARHLTERVFVAAFVKAMLMQQVLSRLRGTE